MTNGGALSLQTSGSLTFTHTGPDTLEIHAPKAGRLQQVKEGTNTGYRILGGNPLNHGKIGKNALDLSYQSLAIKGGAEGDYSTAIGDLALAAGDYSTAIGHGVVASGYASTAMGLGTTAESYGQTTIGFYNTARTASATGFVAEDRLFVIGNGKVNNGKAKPSNALVILKNGNTRLNGALTIHDPTDTTGTSSYTLPTKKGTADQVLTMLDATTGTTTWTTISISDLAFVSGTNTLTIGITGGASQTIDLSQLSNTGTDTQTLTFNPATATVTKTTIALTNGGALSLQTSGSLTFTHTGTDTLEIHAPTAGHLQQVEEAGKNGYRILNSDSDNHGDIGEKALDLSYQSGTSTTTGAIGDYSTAMGGWYHC